MSTYIIDNNTIDYMFRAAGEPRRLALRRDRSRDDDRGSLWWGGAAVSKRHDVVSCARQLGCTSAWPLCNFICCFVIEIHLVSNCLFLKVEFQ
jgi:hypothetical protein